MIIAVSELPENCYSCMFSRDYQYWESSWDWCEALGKEIDIPNKNYKNHNCPLKKLNIDGFWGTIYLGEPIENNS